MNTHGLKETPPDLPKNVLSFAWFKSEASVYHALKGGNSSIQYEQFLPLLLKAAPIIWPGYEVRIHIDDEVKKRPCFEELVRRAANGECRLVHMGKVPNIGIGCLWRLYPVFEDGVDLVVMRDIDTIPTPLDHAAVSEFLRSGMLAHAIHDNPSHSGLMTGMIAFDARGFRGMCGWNTWEEFVLYCASVYSPQEWDTQGSEQRFLNEHVLPRIKGSLFHHALREPARPLGATKAATTVYGVGGPLFALQAQLSLGIGVCQDPKEANAFYGVKDWSVV